MSGDKIVSNLEQPVAQPSAGNGMDLVTLSEGEKTDNAAVVPSESTLLGTDLFADSAAGGLDKFPNLIIDDASANSEAIRASQDLFAEAAKNQTVALLERNLYSVIVRRIEQDGWVATTANPKGEQALAGQWVVDRVDAKGRPVTEGGIAQQWLMSAEEMQKQFNVSADVLSAGKGFASTPPETAHAGAIRLTAPMSVMTDNGLVIAQPGQRIINLDYDAATGKAGTRFLVLSGDETNRGFVGADAASKLLMQRADLIDSREQAGITVFTNKEDLDKYFDQRVADVGQFEFIKTDGQYHAEQVTTDRYPNGLLLSTTDLKFTFTEDVQLPHGGVIKAGQTMPAGVQLYQTEGTWKLKLPMGREIDLGPNVQFEGGQQVPATPIDEQGKAKAETRIVLSRPTYDLEGRLLMDSYTTTLGSLNSLYNPVQVEVSPGKTETWYQPDEGTIVSVNAEVQTPRIMVPLDTNNPISMLSYDGNIMDHVDGNGKPYDAFLIKIPGGKGYYICDAKDLYPLFDGVTDNAVAAKERFMAAMEEAKIRAQSSDAVPNKPIARSSVYVPTSELTEYMKVISVQGDYLTEPLIWANAYGNRENPVDIGMPGDLRIREGNRFYIAPREYTNTAYEQDPNNHETWWKTASFFAAPLGRVETVQGVTGLPEDFLVIPKGKDGLPDRSRQYIVPFANFTSMNTTVEAFGNAIAEGKSPLTLEQAAVNEAMIRQSEALFGKSATAVLDFSVDSVPGIDGNLATADVLPGIFEKGKGFHPFPDAGYSATGERVIADHSLSQKVGRAGALLMLGDLALGMFDSPK